MRSDDFVSTAESMEMAPELSESDLVAALEAGPLENLQYAQYLTEIVHREIVPAWDVKRASNLNLWIPPHENYFLYLYGAIYPGFRTWEFSNHRKAARRGIGICSQQSVIVAGFLKERGCDVRIVPLDGHVVLTAKVGAETSPWHIFDPLFGVSIPVDISVLEDSPLVVRKYYQSAGLDTALITDLEGFYRRPGNYLVDGVNRFHWGGKYYIEKFSYGLIWIIPILLMLPYSAARIGGRGKDGIDSVEAGTSIG